MHTLDSQQVELLGRAALEAQLIRHGFEVARPHRDRGVDLIVYLDREDHFAALPIQMKASSGTMFGAWRKFERVRDLITIYIWNIQSDKPRFFIMTGAEAIALIPDKRKQKKSWTTDRTLAGHGERRRRRSWKICDRTRIDGEWLRARLQSSHVATASKIRNPGKRGLAGGSGG